jgi:signal transduction histidine kinase
MPGCWPSGYPTCGTTPPPSCSARACRWPCSVSTGSRTRWQSSGTGSAAPRSPVRYWSIFNTPVFDTARELIHILNEGQDVTEFIEFQQQGRDPEELTAGLGDRRQRMQVEILRSSQELLSANLALRAANEAKNEFLSRVSHELHTPLRYRPGHRRATQRPAAAYQGHRHRPRHPTGRSGQAVHPVRTS